MDNKNTNTMEILKFKVGSEYAYGTTTFKVIKRTEKTITVETTAWGTMRCKVRNDFNDMESVFFKRWKHITANDLLNDDQFVKDLYTEAYYS
jgi:hypothetical protein